MLTVAAYTGGRKVPSARLRVRQYISPLEKLGIAVREYVSLLGAFPPEKRPLRPIWGVASLTTRIPQVMQSRKYDLTILQREMLSTLATLEVFTKAPRLLDVDDAIWVYRGGGFARRLAGICDGVICGNAFLAEQFSKWNRNVRVLPTAVDTDHFRPLGGEPQQRVIGWCGSSSGLGYLESIELPLMRVFCRHPDARLRVVSDRRPCFKWVPKDKMEFVRWQPEIEVSAIQTMRVGVMPLRDDVWSRGKCSFKMLAYLACGVPAVVSPVGMNREVLGKGLCGIGAATADEWVDALDFLLSNPSRAAEMGKIGRQIVLRDYGLPVLAPRLARLLSQFAGKRGADSETRVGRPSGTVV